MQGVTKLEMSVTRRAPPTVARMVVFRFERRASNEVIAINAISESNGNTTTSAGDPERRLRVFAAAKSRNPAGNASKVQRTISVYPAESCAKFWAKNEVCAMHMKLAYGTITTEHHTRVVTGTSSVSGVGTGDPAPGIGRASGREPGRKPGYGPAARCGFVMLSTV